MIQQKHWMGNCIRVYVQHAYIYICVTIYLFNITHMYIYIYVTVFFHIIVTYLLYIKTYVQHLIIYISYSRMSCVYVYIRNLVVKNQRSENHRSE